MNTQALEGAIIGQLARVDPQPLELQLLFLEVATHPDCTLNNFVQALAALRETQEIALRIDGFSYFYSLTEKGRAAIRAVIDEFVQTLAKKMKATA